MLQGLHSHHWNNPASYQPSIFGNFFQTQKYLPYSETLGSLLASRDTRAEDPGVGYPQAVPTPAGLLPPGKEGRIPRLFCCTNSKLPGYKEKQYFPKNSGAGRKLIRAHGGKQPSTELSNFREKTAFWPKDLNSMSFNCRFTQQPLPRAAGRSKVC